jgi:hypothetical protein
MKRELALRLRQVLPCRRLRQPDPDFPFLLRLIP